MLQTRLWVGALLVIIGLAVLIIDEAFAPWYPGWLILVVGLGIVTCSELLWLVKQHHEVKPWLCYFGVVLVLSANWPSHLDVSTLSTLKEKDAWSWILTAIVVYLLLVFVAELWVYREPGGVTMRMATSVWMLAYIGILPSFLIQLRWLPVKNHQGTVALIMAIFVTKCCDIGAYFTGKFFGKNKMAPVLSPKKTWEGAMGGLLTAVLVTIAIDQLVPQPLLRGVWWAEVGFGITVGGAGIIGDLAESLIKRDAHEKDASQVVPGFGGVLDVIDAVLFSGPVAYFWLVYLGPLLQ